MKILHNGRDISSTADIHECRLYDRYGGLLDNLSISFPYEGSGLTVNKYDKISVSEGGFNSGVMYIDDYDYGLNRFTVSAISGKSTNKARKHKVWTNIRLHKVISDVAGNCGLGIRLYGIENYPYSCLSQINQTDLQFLTEVCRREGYSVKCDNDNLIVFNEKQIENESATLLLSEGEVSPDYEFRRSINGLKSLEVSYFNMTTGQLLQGRAQDGFVDGGADIRTVFCDDRAQAERYARGLLRDANKEYITGYLTMDFNPAISAATCLQLTGFNEFNDRYIVSEAMHDLVNRKTTLKIRRTLDY